MSANAYIEQALKLHQAGELNEAYSLYTSAVSKEPNNVDAIQLKGALCINLEKFEEAEKLLNKAISLMPKQAIFHTNLGIALDNQNKHKQADKHFKLSLELDPENHQSLFAYARALEKQNNLNNAKKMYLKVIRLIPNNEGAMLNLSSIYLAQDNQKDAISVLNNLLEINPNNARALNNLGNIYRNKDLDKALSLFYKSSLMEPGLAPALINLYICAANTCDWNKKNYALQQIKIYKLVIPPLFYNEMTQSLEDNFCNSKKFVQDVQEQYKFKHKVKKKNIISVGYISSDFHNHATMHLMQGLFEEHDYNRLDIHVFSYSKACKNDYVNTLTNLVENFHDISDLSDYEAAKFIFNKNIDILIDLKGHTQGTRLSILAYKPAPIQVHYLGFPGTTAAKYIDYYIGDEIFTPIHMQEYFSEKIINLPHCYQTNTVHSIDRKPSRSEYDLPERGFIFSSFNQCYKISIELFNTWMDILGKTKNTYLWLLADTNNTKANILSQASIAGIDNNRIIFAKGVSRQEHLLRLQLSDLALDTINYNGHTTTSDCIIASVPVLTILGNHPASRVSASILNELSLNELITENLRSYKEKAISIANSNNTERYKSIIRKNRAQSTSFNPSRFARSFERTLINIYEESSHK